MREPYSDETVESVLKHTTRNLALTVAFFVGLLFAHGFLSGCSPQPGPAQGAPRGSVMPDTSRSVVTLLRGRVDVDRCVFEGGCKVRYEDAGNAFAISRDGRTRLLTAAHCIEVPVGAIVRYVAPSGFGHDRARVLSLDAGSDVAELEPFLDAEALTPLPRGPVPVIGARVVAVSALYDARSDGHLTWARGPGWVETDQTIRKGWSGSPVLGQDGRVFGMLSKCHARRAAPSDEGECVPGFAIVSVVR